MQLIQRILAGARAEAVQGARAQFAVAAVTWLLVAYASFDDAAEASLLLGGEARAKGSCLSGLSSLHGDPKRPGLTLTSASRPVRRAIPVSAFYNAQRFRTLEEVGTHGFVGNAREFCNKMDFVGSESLEARQHLASKERSIFPLGHGVVVLLQSF